jgi:hypothetical protein
MLSVLLVVGITSQAAQPIYPGPPPIGAVVKELPGDLWHYISWDTAVVVGIGGGAAAIGHIWDDDLAGEIETNVTLNDAMEPGHTYGAFSFQVFIGTGMYATGWFAKKGRFARAGADIMRAQLVSQAYVQASSTPHSASGRTGRIISRFRPDTPPARLPRPVCCGVTTAGKSEFPLPCSQRMWRQRACATTSTT